MSPFRARPAPISSFALIALAACSTPAPSPYVTAATQPMAIPVVGGALPVHAPEQPGNPTSKGSGSANASWFFIGAPKDGLDAIRVSITPSRLDNAPNNIVYWAFEGYYVDQGTWYFGLQPSGQYGMTALFSVFGDGTTPLGPACASGADGGSGTHCHIPYTWSVGKTYEFIVRLVRGDTGTYVWEGTVIDVATGKATVIGDIGVSASRGLLAATGVTFAEFFKRPTPCPEEPISEALFSNGVGYRSGKPYAWSAHSLNPNSGCSPRFYGDGKTYLYLQNGG